jgi:hypothetical protein
MFGLFRYLSLCLPVCQRKTMVGLGLYQMMDLFVGSFLPMALETKSLSSPFS